MDRQTITGPSNEERYRRVRTVLLDLAPGQSQQQI
ncbi:hypothetical protein FB565_008875 [Actinoplanes lutulentus]|nr:hypothetical protein [Actinoplanes lutulentus]